MGYREVYRRFRAEILGKPNGLGKGDGLSVDTGTDYDFHKDVVESKLIPLHTLATDRLNIIASCILHARRTVAGEVHDRGIEYYANRVQYIYYRAAARTLLSLGCLDGKDVEALEKMGIIHYKDGGAHLITSDDMCRNCGIPLIVGTDTSNICGKCSFFSTLKVPTEGTVD